MTRWLSNAEEVADAIRSLESGKSCGLDGVTAEHLKLCSDVVVEMLSVCFTCMFIHGYLLKDMLSIVLIPILKDKARNLVKRTIDLLPWRVSRPRYWRWLYTRRIEGLLETCGTQFGFKRKHGDKYVYLCLKRVRA